MHVTYTNAAIASQRRADYETRAARHRQAKAIKAERSARPAVDTPASGGSIRSWTGRVGSSILYLGRTRPAAGSWSMEPADAS